MSVAMDQAASINYQRPFFGGTIGWVGKSEEALVAASKAVINDFKALIDPAQKERIILEENSVLAVEGGVNAVFTSIGDAARKVVSATGKIVSPLTSGFHWLVAGLVAIAAIYLLSIVKGARA